MNGFSRAEVREAIAEAMADSYKAYELEVECDRLGLRSSVAEPSASKRIYVRDRLADLEVAALQEVARRVAQDTGHPDVVAYDSVGGFRGVAGELRNLIFAADGPKPRIVLRDAISNVVEVVEGADRCLFYDRPLGDEGLTWDALVDWWTELTDDQEPARSLYRRLLASLNGAERKVLRAYAGRYGAPDGGAAPALLPQVYLHYDPYTLKELRARGSQVQLARQRMDFLLLLAGGRRIVLEVDGKQHFAEDDGSASPGRYAEMVREDRRLRLGGYEVYRFGGAELADSSAASSMLEAFFADLLAA